MCKLLVVSCLLGLVEVMELVWGLDNILGFDQETGVPLRMVDLRWPSGVKRLKLAGWPGVRLGGRPRRLVGL